MLEFDQRSQFAKAVSSIPSIVDNYLASKLKEEVNVAVQLQSNKLKEEAEAENQESINQVDSTINKIIMRHVKAQVSKIMPQIEDYVTESLGVKVLDEMIKTRMKTPPMDQTEGRKEESQARMLNHQKAQSQKNQSHPALPKAPNISINLLISTIAKECYKERQPPCTFDELMGTPIDFSAFVMNRLKIDNLTQEILVRPSFNLLKGTCKSFVELEYHFEECYKAINDRLDWHNPKGRKNLFDLSKPLPLIEVQRRQVVPANYFINNDLEYLKEEIVVRRDNNVLYKFKECDFPKPNLCDIKDMLLLLVQKKLSNLDVDDRYSLGVALRMFTRCIIILHRVKDLPLRVESYQKQLNITRPETFRSDIPNMIPYNGYTNP
uniref:Uncharacterized protein n=1 Tax=Tanacetum cinerariifolium TaxID=118510 RepID=A0A6L2KV28_TANCI|nr:hypothetical protein [Tanacetum cinerariifolium]